MMTRHNQARMELARSILDRLDALRPGEAFHLRREPSADFGGLVATIAGPLGDQSTAVGLRAASAIVGAFRAYDTNVMGNRRDFEHHDMDVIGETAEIVLGYDNPVMGQAKPTTKKRGI